MSLTERSCPELEGCFVACDRCELLLDALDGRTYVEIGAHLRHCIDHFRCLLRGVAAGAVDYDARDRDPSLERDPARARRALEQVRSELESLDAEALTRPLTVRQSAAPGRDPVASRSTLGRELVFLSSHTIHHLEAMLLRAAARGAELPAGLSLAFSTESYRAGPGHPER